MVYILCRDNILSEIQFRRLALLVYLTGDHEVGVPGADKFIVGADILGRASLLAEGMKMTGKLARGFAFIACWPAVWYVELGRKLTISRIIKLQLADSQDCD